MIKLADPDIGPEELEELAGVVASRQVTQAGEVAAFEKALAEIVGTAGVVAVSSGTAALLLALKALGIGAGDEVIVPAFTFPATANAVVHAGAEPVFVDVEADTLNIDCELIRHTVTNKTRAIIPVHLFGLPADMDALLEIAASGGVPVIEDAACALGAEYKRRHAGSLGEMGCFSFHARKVVTTGEGGAVSTDDSRLAESVRSWRNHGSVGSGRCADFALPGYNFRMSELHAALGMAQLERFQEILAKRNAVAARYDSLLSELEEVKVVRTPRGVRRVYQSYVVLLADSIDRDEVIEQMAARGVEAGIGTYLVPSGSYYRKILGVAPEQFPNALRAYRQSLSLPLSSRMDEDQADQVSSVLREAIALQG